MHFGQAIMVAFPVISAERISVIDLAANAFQALGRWLAHNHAAIALALTLAPHVALTAWAGALGILMSD